MMKVYQEFYCHWCPDGGTYIKVPLNMALNYRVVIVCPLCKRQHERVIENGQIFDRGKNELFVEEICPPKSACSKTPWHVKIKSHARNGEVFRSKDDLRTQTMKEAWGERFASG